MRAFIPQVCGKQCDFSREEAAFKALRCDSDQPAGCWRGTLEGPSDSACVLKRSFGEGD
jgi:hypothetical protein